MLRYRHHCKFAYPWSVTDRKDAIVDLLFPYAYGRLISLLKTFYQESKISILACVQTLLEAFAWVIPLGENL